MHKIELANTILIFFSLIQKRKQLPQLLVIIQRFFKRRIKQSIRLMSLTLPRLLVIIALILSFQTCDVGKYADSNGTCRQCDISCSTCQSSDGCSTCYDQMFLVQKGNTIVCDVCYNVNKGCDICLTGTKCQNCSAGYYLESDNTCSNCTNLTPYCLLCNTGNSTECVSCLYPYELIDGVCVSSTSNSTTSSGSSGSSDSSGIAAQTLTQPQTLYKSASTQQSQSSSAQITGGNQQIVTCDPSQININGVCYATIAFCLTYNQTDGSCLTCSSIFVLNNGYCLPSSLITGSSSQSQSSSGISSSASSGSSSQQASTIYVPCTSHQYYKDGVCVDVAAQCTQFDISTGTCYSCSQGYSLSSGSCVASSSSGSPQNSLSTSSLNAFLGGRVPNCQVVDPSDSTHCLICSNGYTIVDQFPGVCYKIY